jgi:hypothetical protein
LFAALAKLTETHRQAQKDLDDASEDALWDWKEDFRLELEDREATLEAACDEIRMTTSYDELNKHFDTVQQVLDGIQASYRTYHGRACFLADKHPLSLSQECQEHLLSFCQVLKMAPKMRHPVRTTFRHQDKEMRRLNRTYVQEEQEKEAQAQAKSAAEAKAKARAAVVAAAIEAGEEPPPEEPEPEPEPENEAEAEAEPTEDQGEGGDVGEDEEGEGAASGTIEALEGPEIDHVETFESPLLSAPPLKISTEDSAAEPPPHTTVPVDTYAGAYGLSSPLAAFASKLTEEPEDEEEAAASAAKGEADEAEGTAAESEGSEPEPEQPAVHEEQPWLLASFQAVSEEEREAWDLDDKFTYDVSLAQSFVPLSGERVEEMETAAAEAQTAAAEAAARVEASPDDEAVVEEAQEALALALRLADRCSGYRDMAPKLAALQGRVAIESDPEYIRKHPPVVQAAMSSRHLQPWVHFLELAPVEAQTLVESIRASLCTALEIEAFDRVALATELNKQRKAALTDELEDRLRTHWPRRGRVETTIKQPREAELLSHEEKTWRHIQAVQEKMVDLQARFEASVAAEYVSCETYKADMAALQDKVSDSSRFRTLAALQGVDQKARHTLLTFQQGCAAARKHVASLLKDEPEVILTFAQEFRKVCPLQVPGQEGGYSEAEINEIAELVGGQCGEIGQLQELWGQQADELFAQQAQAQEAQEAFQIVYDNCSLELQLFEGLGQKYGAPRRRAQERMRTAVSRDEQAAGKLDEALAKAEFLAAERRRELEAEAARAFALANGKEGEDAADSGPPGTGLPPDPNFEGRAPLLNANELWALLNRARTMLVVRCSFLNVQEQALENDCSANPPDQGGLQWLDLMSDRMRAMTSGVVEAKDDMFADDAPKDPAVELLAEQEAAQAAAAASCFSELVAEIEAGCRQETIDLYTSEGRADALGDSVPASLTTWLAEANRKLLGPEGYRERAWKRLWGQIERLEVLLNRRPDGGWAAGDDDEGAAPEDTKAATLADKKAQQEALMRMGAPAAGLSFLRDSFVKVDDYTHPPTFFLSFLLSFFFLSFSLSTL